MKYLWIVAALVIAFWLFQTGHSGRGTGILLLMVFLFLSWIQDRVLHPEHYEPRPPRPNVGEVAVFEGTYRNNKSFGCFHDGREGFYHLAIPEEDDCPWLDTDFPVSRYSIKFRGKIVSECTLRFFGKGEFGKIEVIEMLLVEEIDDVVYR